MAKSRASTPPERTGIKALEETRRDLSTGWREAFKPDETDGTQREWEAFSKEFGRDMTAEERRLLLKEWDSRTGAVYGYISTSNAFRINEILYDPKNDGKTDEEMFTRTDRAGELRDLHTVKALDKAISQHKTPRDAIYTRYTGDDAMVATYGLSSEQQSLLRKVLSLRSTRGITPEHISALNDALRGRTGYNPSFTSTSANHNLNVFRGRPVERRFYTPAGTNALAASTNKVESEVVFGRGLKTELDHISLSRDGHIVFHERVLGYKKK